MSIFSKTNTNASYVSSFEGLDCSSVASMYTSVVIERLITATLGSLCKKEIFEKMYSYGLVSFLKYLIINGSLDCWVYSQGNKYLAITNKKENDFHLFIPKQVKIVGKATDLYKHIALVANSLSSLVNGVSTNITLSKSVVFKMDGVRSRVPADYTDAISKVVSDKINNNSILTLDSKDEILNGLPIANSDNLKKQMELLLLSLSATTGFPLSFFSGDFGGGIASTTESEKSRLYDAKEQFFNRYLEPFFSFISFEIKPEKTLADSYSLAEIQNFLIAFEEKIDLDNTLTNLGFKLK